jgi:23S rRNA (adenine2503-C2)-methyltransferase
MKTDIKSLTPEELGTFLELIGEKKYRARQIFGWLYKGVYSFSEMTDLSKELREKLEETAYIERLTIEKMQISQKDGTRKYLFGLRSGDAIESVFMKYKYGNTVCVSSQAGCRMNCAFCASGASGFVRSLTAAEMVDQIIGIEKETGERIGNIVVMGTGEPFENYETLCRFLTLVHAKEGLNISLRSITVSTCGIIPKMEAFARDFPQVNLAVSLHAPNDRIRDQLVPINRKFPIDQLLAASRKHIEKTGRRITFEYALIKGINDKESNAVELAEILSRMICHVNLIPLNPVAESKFEGTDRKEAEYFLSVLERKGIQATIRRELGTDIDGACGQLRLSAKK